MQTKHIHCIGIGGIGISALARHYLHEGWEVSGSDQNKSENTEKLGAENGDIILFSPAFASFAQYKNEYERNDTFMQLVERV
jgi:UDP-N-acetylmuramate-alanine ligase